MWDFVGKIDYVCNQCTSRKSASIDDFEIEISGSDERSMGPETIYSLTFETVCEECDNDILLKFDVSEYPQGAIDFIFDMTEGAQALNKPEIDYLPEEDELFWVIKTSNQAKILEDHLKSVKTILDLEVDDDTRFSLLVMLHGHIVAAIEGYLASTFIHNVTNSDELIKKLVESDPEFSKRKFTLKEIFEKQSTLKITVATYLNDLIFHDLKKIKPMYRNVLNHDFGEIGWLFRAVEIRHHCVHRAGYDKTESPIDISRESISTLLDQVKTLATRVEDSIARLDSSEDIPF